jgi:hypothetical protein
MVDGVRYGSIYAVPRLLLQFLVVMARARHRLVNQVTSGDDVGGVAV